MEYQSQIEYESSRIHAAAVYCSDGRVGEMFDDFLQNGLKLPRYDRVALPGGPAVLAGHTEAHVEEQGIINELNFLVEVHGLTRVVLIAHQGCAFYAARLGLPPSFIEHQQMIDLIKASRFIQRITPVKQVEAYIARVTGKSVRFEGVKLD
jgi:hypothetical protein